MSENSGKYFKPLPKETSKKFQLCTQMHISSLLWFKLADILQCLSRLYSQQAFDIQKWLMLMFGNFRIVHKDSG